MQKQDLQQDVPTIPEGVGASRYHSEDFVLEGVGGTRPQHMEVLPGDDSTAKGTQRDLQHLNTDLLVEVFSYLPQTELHEVMTACRPWEKAVMGASVLWKEVKVYMKWDRGDDEVIQRVFNFAQELTFSYARGSMRTQMMSVAGLEIPTFDLYSYRKIV